MQEIAGGRRPGTRRVLVGTVAIVIVEAAIFIFTISGIVARHGDAASAGWKCRLVPPVWVVSEMDQRAAATGLRKGDEVLSVNGSKPGWLGPALKLLVLQPGEPYTVTGQRGARTVSWRLFMGRNASVSLIDIGATLLFALLFCAAGLVIRLGGQNDVTARLGNTCFFLGGMSMLGPVLLIYPGWGTSTSWLAVALARLPRPLQMSFGWDFLSRFPHRVPEGLPSKALRVVFYAVAIVLWASFNLPVFAEIADLPYPPAWTPLQWLGRDGPFAAVADIAFDGVVSAAGVFIVVRNYRLMRDWDSRRRIRLVAVFFGLGAVCLLCLRTLELANSLTNSPALGTATAVLEVATTVAMGLVPIALVYAFVKHRVLGIRLVIRLGLQYLLAKNVLRVVLLAPVLMVLAEIVRSPDRSFFDLLLHSSWRFYLPVVVTAALSLSYRHELTQWLDGRFFRVAMREEELLLTMTESIRTAATEDEVARAAEQQIERALAVDGIGIFFRSASSGDLEAILSHSPIDVAALDGLLGRHRRLERAKKSRATVPLTIRDPVPLDQAFSDGGERLVVPLKGSDEKTFGAFVLGPKKSEENYTRRDREFLQAIGAQVVMACEVMRLKREVEQGSRQRVTVLGRLERENIRLLHECLVCGDCYDTSESRCPKDGTALQLTLPVERLVAGRYRLDRRLGAGGMGFVYEALDVRLEKRVAVKIMVGELFGNQEALMRFRREAQAIASLEHPNIVGMQDFGQLPAGGAFLVMDLVRGEAWRSYLRRQEALSPERVAGWVEGLCEGMGAAHRAGIIHRDVKPENVMISEGERAMILDFGLAKVKPGLEPSGLSNISVTGMILGTLSYMSPEQRAGQMVGPSSDIFSIGVMTLETLARVGPPEVGATPEWIRQTLQQVVKPGGKLEGLLKSALLDAAEERMKPVEIFGRLVAEEIRLEKPRAASISAGSESETRSLGATMEVDK